MCGNDLIDHDEDEECDGDDLDSETCARLGYGGGALHCDPVTCTFDTSMCVSGSTSTGGTGGGSVGGSGG